MSRISRQLGQLLVDHRLLSKDDFEVELQKADATGTPLASLLISNGQVRRTDLLRALAAQLEIPFFEFEGRTADDISVAALRRVDRAVAEQFDGLPAAVDAEGRLVIAVADPFSTSKRDSIRSAIGEEVVLGLAPAESIAPVIRHDYDLLNALTPVDLEDVEPGFDDSIGAMVARPDADRTEWPHINELLEILIERGGSDLHLTAGSAPQIRVHGQLEVLPEFGMMKPAGLRSMVYEILTSRQREEFEENRELDCSHPLPGKGRFRVNVFFQRDSVGAVMRAIPNEILSLDQLNMPPVVGNLSRLSRGLVLVTGPTGSGKSTTLASLIDLINSTRACHVMSVEDPIEFMHKHKRAIVNQREVGADTESFAEALRRALRQDPDVILVGEMRDLETISTAITASETGHLVFGTLHTQDAPQSIERMIDVFPSFQQQQVRVQVAGSIQAVVSQQLVSTRGANGRVAAVEVMVATPAIRNLIREGRVHQIASALQAGGKFGMQTMDQSLADLVKAGLVDYKVAYERCHNPAEFETLAKRAQP